MALQANFLHIEKYFIKMKETIKTIDFFFFNQKKKQLKLY